MPERRYEPSEIEPRWQALWAAERTWEVVERGRGLDAGRPRRRGSRELIRARDAPLPQRGAPHRAPQVLRGGRCDRALPPQARPPRAAPDGLRLVRAARREPRDQDGRAPAHLDRRVDRVLPSPVPRVGDLDRLVARARDARARVLPLDAVDLPRAPARGARLPQGGRGQVVSQRPDGARQRAGRRGRAMRALRCARRGAPARAVVLPHHRLRRAAARRPRRRSTGPST